MESRKILTRQDIRELMCRSLIEIGRVDTETGLKHFGDYVEAVLDYIDSKVQ